jgi:hypothetical protein
MLERIMLDIMYDVRAAKTSPKSRSIARWSKGKKLPLIRKKQDKGRGLTAVRA